LLQPGVPYSDAQHRPVGGRGDAVHGCAQSEYGLYADALQPPDGRLSPYALPDTAPGAPGQLYNLRTDPGETTNLYFEHPEIVKKLKRLLEESKTSGRSAPERS
jgi:hypothetical protein